jgi:hypothetical protein
MNDVSGSSQLVGECEESRGLALCMVEQQHLGHDARSTTLGLFETPHLDDELCRVRECARLLSVL